MSNSLYMLRCSDRSYFARYTVILITSRDCNHITWFRNSASVSLLAILSHRTWIANDFSSSQLFQKRSKISDCTFWKFFYKRKFSFLFIFCTRNRHSTVIESYIRRNDVIRCELDLTLIEKIDSLFSFTNHCRDEIDKLSQIVVAKTFCRKNNYSIFKTARNWTNLSLINDFVRSSIIIWLINT
jgi:hypothetical protein